MGKAIYRLSDRNLAKRTIHRWSNGAADLRSWLVIRARHSAGVMAGIDRQLRILPPSLRQSITFDPGTEFAAFLILREKLSIASYFCMPSAPCQKVSVEITNDRLRRFLPLDTELAKLE